MIEVINQGDSSSLISSREDIDTCRLDGYAIQYGVVWFLIKT